MEKNTKPTSKKKPMDDMFIVSKYMEQVLSTNEEPKNVFIFCKDNKISESDFYTFFGSIDSLKKEIWLKFFENAIDIMEKEEAYEGYTDKNKLLTLYFTLFELFTANRSYILFSIPNNREGLRNLKSLNLFRSYFKTYITKLLESGNSEIYKKSAMFSSPILSEAAWIQFLAILKFWLDDSSKSFESTDILIEKSVNTVVDLLNSKPLEGLLDLGKFLWKEKMV